MEKEVYYLISQDYYDNEIMDVIKKNDILSKINEKETIEIDMEEIENVFEVMEEEVYRIIRIHKNEGKFKVGNKIYVDYGMISFYTKKMNGEIDEISVFPMKIIKKERILFYNSKMD